MNVLIWFKRDLRLHDHPALSHLTGEEAVLPLYIVEPEYWAQPDTSARQWAFTADCLADLRGDLAAVGAPLVVRTGAAVEVLERFCRQHRISRILSHQEVGNLWTFARDRAVAAWARSAGVEWVEVAQSGVVRGLRGRKGWAGMRDGFAALPALPAPQGLRAIAGIEPGVIPQTRALRLVDDPCPHRQAGGRAPALLALDSFLNQRGESYRSAMSSPLSAERACSRLSPYLALGALSGREVEQAAAARAAMRPGGGWGGSLRSFQSRLAWRDHFMQKLEAEPQIELRALHRAADALRPRVPDAVRLRAFAAGETGVPFVDACLRYLAATGWLNFRARAMLMSFASYHLWLDWRAAGAVLARRFTDYEPGIHWPQVQMQSGVTGINALRVYNPVKQGAEQDPGGAFVRRWVPELAGVPDGFVQQPWLWPGAAGVLGRRYPEPLVDLTTAAREARDAIWSLRRKPGFAAVSAQVVERHASPASARFVNDRSPARRNRQVDASQMALDL